MTGHISVRMFIIKKVDYEFEALSPDPAIAEELRTFVDCRQEEGGAPTDFLE